MWTLECQTTWGLIKQKYEKETNYCMNLKLEPEV